MKLVFHTAMILILSVFLLTDSKASENIFYILRGDSPSQEPLWQQNSFASLKEHYQSIHTVISQAYQVDQDGVVWGSINPEVAEFVKSHNIKLIAMITNAGFNQNKVHQFLNNPIAQQRAIQSILTACLANHYDGIQFDYEMVALEDRDALTHFYLTAAEELHKNKLIVSFAVAPVVGDGPQPSDFLKRSYTVWQGAYDLKALGQAADFISVMAYSQHSESTTPGPAASYPWVEQTIKYVSQYVPADKISLGLASYSSYWFTGANPTDATGKFTMRLAEIGYEKVIELLQKNHATLYWDETNKINFTSYQNNWLGEYLFVEDAKSFTQKLALVKKYKLRGISVFRLGLEDPKVWDTLAMK